MKLTLFGIVRIVIFIALILAAIFVFTSCKKENSVEPALISNTTDSINVRIQSVDIDGKNDYSLQTRYVN